MFDFLLGSGMHSPNAAMRRALESDDLPPGTNVRALGVVEKPGTFEGRPVSYFRVFDPERAAARAINLLTKHAYSEFGSQLHLVLRSGFIEKDGTVVLFRREPASRSAHPSSGPERQAVVASA